MDDLPAAPRLTQVARGLGMALPEEPITEVFSRCRWCGAYHLMDCPYIIVQEWYESGAKKSTRLESRAHMHKEVAFYSEEDVRAALEESEKTLDALLKAEADAE
jgi:hypothetical protein